MKNGKPTGGYDRLKAKYEERERNFNELKSAADQLTQRNDDLERQNIKFANRISDLEESKRSLLREIDELEQQRDDLKKQNTGLQMEATNLQKETFDMKRDIEYLQGSKNALEKQLADRDYKIQCRDERIEGQERRLYEYWQHMGRLRRWLWSLKREE